METPKEVISAASGGAVRTGRGKLLRTAAHRREVTGAHPAAAAHVVELFDLAPLGAALGPAAETAHAGAVRERADLGVVGARAAAHVQHVVPRNPGNLHHPGAARRAAA